MLLTFLALPSLFYCNRSIFDTEWYFLDVNEKIIYLWAHIFKICIGNVIPTIVLIDLFAWVFQMHTRSGKKNLDYTRFEQNKTDAWLKMMVVIIPALLLQWPKVVSGYLGKFEPMDLQICSTMSSMSLFLCTAVAPRIFINSISIIL